MTFHLAGRIALKCVMRELMAAKTAKERFYALNDAAKESFDVGKFEDAQKYAQELIVLRTEVPRELELWNAVQDANLVLVELLSGKDGLTTLSGILIEAGRVRLTADGHFGPNISLVKTFLRRESGNRCLSISSSVGSFGKCMTND